MPKIDLVGKTYGRLTVLSQSLRSGNNPYWLCKCTCGVEKPVRGECLKNGSIRSCGCLAKEVRASNATKHNMSSALEYVPWANMIRRCNNPKNKSYHLYGGMGIRVCEEWKDFPTFLQDMGSIPFPKSTIERIDKDGDFTPANCRWGNLKKREQKVIVRTFPDITGEVFGQLTAISIYEKKDNSSAPRWLFKCFCGNTCIKSQSKLRIKRERSCGCVRPTRQGSHGMSTSREYYIWSSMKERCNNPKNKHYKYYGEKGIVVCERWLEFMNFITDMGRVPDGYSIERINNNGNYEPSNCKWIPKAAQGSNTSRNHYVEFEGKRLHIEAWVRELGIKSHQLKHLLHYKKLSFPDAIAELRLKGKC